MRYSEAKEIRRRIVVLCPDSKHKARNISKRVMQALWNEREEVAYELGGIEHVAADYEIDNKYGAALGRALLLALM